MNTSIGSDKVLLTRQRDAVLYITLNRPNSGNSLSPKLIGELLEIWQRLGDDRTVKVVVQK